LFRKNESKSSKESNTRASSFISIYGNLNERPVSTSEFEQAPGLSTIEGASVGG